MTVGRQNIIITTCILMVGMVLPFIDYLVVIEVFYLLIPMTILFLASVAMLIYYLIRDKSRLKKSILYIISIPTFMTGQFISTWTVNKVQRHRSEYAIKEIQTFITQTGHLPDDYPTTFGIKFSKLDSIDEFKISYSRGFMVTENYYSKEKIWKSVGWRD